MRHAPLLVLTLLAACWRTAAPPPEKPAASAPQAAPAEAGKFRVSGPYVHDNLAVYLIHSAERDERDFGTLDEGLKDGTVSISEKEQEQVSELLLENRGDKPVFIQEGDRVKGGKQDRIVGLSFVVPPMSGKIGIPSFCVEQGRWASGKEGKSFSQTAYLALADKKVRYAAKAGKDQGGVWQQVAETKTAGVRILGTENTNSSLNETMDSDQARKAAEPFEKALTGLLATHPDAVGAAFALNGKIEEITVYPGHRLFAKLYPRLIGSYALAAALEKKIGAVPTTADVAAFMKEGRERSKRTENVAGNSVTVRELEANVQCLTEYQGKAVHTQWLLRNEPSGRPAGNEGQQQQEQNNTPRR
jgi:hypothetical protein